MSSLKNLLVNENTSRKRKKKDAVWREASFGDIWVEVNGSVASVGITKNLEMELGDIVIFEFFKTSGYIQEGEEFARIESIYKTYTLKSPVSGYIRWVNRELPFDPTLLNYYQKKQK